MAGALELLVALTVASPAKTTSAAVPLVDVTRLAPNLLLDIRYATADNFFQRKIYPEARCLLRREVAPKLVAADRWLATHHPNLRLMLKDCYRPASLQRVLYDAVKGTPKAAYVSRPSAKKGSIHSYGAAVDLTLCDATGKELDMGTPYDFLGPRAEPRRETAALASGELSKAQVANRGILRAAMRAGGFRAIPNEWWHFDDDKKEIVRARYEQLDVPFSAVP